MYRVDDSLFFQLFAVQYCDDDNEIEFLEVIPAPKNLEESVTNATLQEEIAKQNAEIDAKIGALNEELSQAHASAKLDWEEGAGAALAPKAEPTVWIDSNPDYYDVISVDPVLTHDVIEKGLLSWDQLAKVFNQTD